MEESFKISDVVCLITPARFLFDAGQTPKDWNKKMLNDEHLGIILFEQDSSKIFPNISIPGGVAITIRDANKLLGPIGFFSPFQESSSILNKVLSNKFKPITSIVFGNSSYKLTEQLYIEIPELKRKSYAWGRKGHWH
ncbi:MAG: Eco57I restriction-modification methylase domain-containing protein [Patescibacteria group bacterium]